MGFNTVILLPPAIQILLIARHIHSPPEAIIRNVRVREPCPASVSRTSGRLWILGEGSLDVPEGGVTRGHNVNDGRTTGRDGPPDGIRQVGGAFHPDAIAAHGAPDGRMVIISEFRGDRPRNLTVAHPSQHGIV